MGFYCLQKYKVWLYAMLTASIRTFSCVLQTTVWQVAAKNDVDSTFLQNITTYMLEYTML
jgi:hypothetical protein